MSETVYIEIEI